ncbi:MAG: formate dehydrogenase accessory sulfurtransferase FdhD [Planctomycetota bacterium]
MTGPTGPTGPMGPNGEMVWRWNGAGPLREDRDELAPEAPLEIRVNRRPVSVTMRTPGHDRELALGFLFTEGIVRRREDIAEAVEREGLVDVRLAPGCNADLGRLTRHVFASSSCGICGKASIEAVEGCFAPLDPPAPNVPGGPLPASSAPVAYTTPAVALRWLAGLPAALREVQATFARTGGLHATALFDCTEPGRLICAREDVGRHNAMDKVIGRALLDGLIPLSHHLLLVSGRSSFEIVQKTLAARVPILAGLSAPSSLAVELARESGITLVGFLRENRLNLYSHPGRVTADEA